MKKQLDKEIKVPEWLIKNENYIPQSDKDTFINKSILALLNLLSRIRSQGNKTYTFSLNANLKFVFTFLLIILISLSRSFTFIIIIDVYLLVILSLMNAAEIIKILKISFITAGFTFIILLPAVLWSNSYSSIIISSKVLATVAAVNILSYSTKWNDITAALRSFFLPDIFILVLDISIKYIVMLGDFSLNMFYSLKLRSVGSNKNKYTSLSGIAGTMFIKSKEMAEEMYSAMECRGFTGEYHKNKESSFTLKDFIYTIINIGIIFIFIYLERI